MVQRHYFFTYIYNNSGYKWAFCYQKCKRRKTDTLIKEKIIYCEQYEPNYNIFLLLQIQMGSMLSELNGTYNNIS